MHTPGPWECSIYCDNVSWHYRLFAKETDLAAKANARLIAAAPDMLTALENCVAWAEGYESKTGIKPTWLDEARTAIAKATGKEGLE